MSAEPVSEDRNLNAEDPVWLELAKFYNECHKNPELVPYFGPRDLLDRFFAGEIVTSDELLKDLSPWTIKAVLPSQMRRLEWMLDREVSR